MFDRTDLDLRYRDHAMRIQRAGRYPASDEPATHRARGPRILAADLLLSICRRLAPDEVRRATRGETATA